MSTVSLSERAAPGELIVFRCRPHLPAKHVGILVCFGRMVHTYNAAGKVAQGNLASA
jgi:cell wall-associated NlpC family hydrolase